MNALLENADTSQLVLSFLTYKDVEDFMIVNKAARNQAQKNQCEVLAVVKDDKSLKYSVWNIFSQECKAVATKENALALLEEYKNDSNVDYVEISHYEQELEDSSWSFPEPIWTVEWERPIEESVWYGATHFRL